MIEKGFASPKPRGCGLWSPPCESVLGILRAPNATDVPPPAVEAGLATEAVSDSRARLRRATQCTEKESLASSRTARGRPFGHAVHR